jgi:hypothetical protein
MVLIGVLYLAFEDAILGVSTIKYHLSRTIIGIQVSCRADLKVTCTDLNRSDS